MSSPQDALRGLCPEPFFQDTMFTGGGYVDSRICQTTGNITCCVPCPITDWLYPDSFNAASSAAQWIAVVSTVCCVFILVSWATLPPEKTARHYLSICLAIAVLCMNLAFVIPLAANPEECYDKITPNGMQTSAACAASGSFIIFGGYGAVFWVFLRALSLHLQICWQVVVGRTFMWFAQVMGWGISSLGLMLTLVFSGVSFRFGSTCHTNHKNSTAALWVPLLVIAGVTIIVQFATFGYCVKVYLASLADDQATTENSNMRSYSNSVRTLTPKQAYRRVRRVIQLQWRGIAIVLIIVADVIFFSVVFVFQDNTMITMKNDASLSLPWVTCLVSTKGDKNACLQYTGPLVVHIGTIAAVLVLLAMNGIWLLLLGGRWSMVTGWMELLGASPGRGKGEFVSVDARLGHVKKEARSYEMLSRDDKRIMYPAGRNPSLMKPLPPIVRSPDPYRSPSAGFYYNSGPKTALRDPRAPAVIPPPPVITAEAARRRTPDFFANASSRYHAPARATPHWSLSSLGLAPMPQVQSGDEYVNPLGMNRL